MTATIPPLTGGLPRCRRCDTELALTALSCPACATLVHGDRLTALAAIADEREHAGDLATAANMWQEALSMLPTTSQQYAVVQARAADLRKRADEHASPMRRVATTSGPWWKRGGSGLIALLVLAASKLKFLLLGLTKMGTLFSMFGFFGVYWAMFGWPLAAGMVISIYIHEMGHVAMLRRLGIAAGAPLFIPGIGALVRLRQRVDNPLDDAKVGLAGPVWGLGAGLAAYAVYLVTHAPIWAAITGLTGVINLFNLIPVWQLDGSRGFHALSTGQRWAIVGVTGLAYLLTQQSMLVIIGAVAIYRAVDKGPRSSSVATLATFSALILSLAWLSGLQPTLSP